MDFQVSLFRYVFDASSLINIERNRKITQLRRRRAEVLIPEKVAEEVQQPNTPLGRFINKYYHQVVINFEENEEYEYLRIRGQKDIHDGEATVIAIAVSRRLPIVIDDVAGRNKAKNHQIRTLSWEDFIRGY